MIDAPPWPALVAASDRPLIEVSAASDRTRVSLPEALERETPVLLAAARAMTLDDDEAEDLVQTTLEVAVRKAHTLREPAALRAWLLTIQGREAFRVLRRLRRLVRLDRSVTEIPVPSTDADESILVRAALARLSPRVRAAVVLHHMAGLSVAETPRALGISNNTVKSHLKTGMSRLRVELERD